MTKLIDKSKSTDPLPPNSERRVDPLPGQSVKSSRDEPEATRRVDELLRTSTYLPADIDLEFLDKDDIRGLRLELDYLKPEWYLRKYGIERTIVVFGSTRILEPSAADRKVRGLERELRQKPGDRVLFRRLEIARRVLVNSAYYDIAREFGRLVGQSGGGPNDCRVTLMTGGGPGIMEAANRGAFDVGAKSIGLNITLPHEQYPNPYISTELCFSVRYFAIRKLHFLLRAAALVVFPGGFGTIDELFETLNLVQCRKIDPLPIVLVGERYWRGVFNPDFLVDEGVIDPEDRDLFWYAESATDTWDQIVEWHKTAGSPLLCEPGDEQ